MRIHTHTYECMCVPIVCWFCFCGGPQLIQSLVNCHTVWIDKDRLYRLRHQRIPSEINLNCTLNKRTIIFGSSYNGIVTLTVNELRKLDKYTKHYFYALESNSLRTVIPDRKKTHYPVILLGGISKATVQGHRTQAESSGLAGWRERISGFGASFQHSWRLEGRMLEKEP